ncbi:hypothetical protein SIPHO076v1_p0088 [Vibrio phage PS34B.1]|nr:hypothetical protein SIPHO076v1_p0088 [Vibrio phage PS34B.1]
MGKRQELIDVLGLNNIGCDYTWEEVLQKVKTLKRDDRDKDALEYETDNLRKDNDHLCGQVLKLRNYQHKTIDDSQLIEVGKKDKRKVSPLNKELYDLAQEVMVSDEAEDAKYSLTSKWHIGFRDVSEFINELEKRYDITPKTDGDNV